MWSARGSTHSAYAAAATAAARQRAVLRAGCRCGWHLCVDGASAQCIWSLLNRFTMSIPGTYRVICNNIRLYNADIRHSLNKIQKRYLCVTSRNVGTNLPIFTKYLRKYLPDSLSKIGESKVATPIFTSILYYEFGNIEDDIYPI